MAFVTQKKDIIRNEKESQAFHHGPKILPSLFPVFSSEFAATFKPPSTKPDPLKNLALTFLSSLSLTPLKGTCGIKGNKRAC